MDNLNPIMIRDADEWTCLENPVFKQDLAECSSAAEGKSDSLSVNKKKPIKITSPVLTFQLVIVLLILITSFLSKTFFFEKYHLIKECYDEEITASMIFDGEFGSLDYSEFFSAVR